MQFEVPSRLAEAVPDSARVARIRDQFAESAAPVRPLPSNIAMVTMGVAVFAVLAILFAVPLGFPGFLTMSMAARVLIYTAIILLAIVLAAIVVSQMIPGSRRLVPPWAAALDAVVTLSLAAAVLFPDFAMENFVRSGVPCLRVGLLCAVPAGVLIRTAMRRGFLTDKAGAGIAGGALAGLLGVAVLALHCPVFNAAHIIVWHVGAVAVAALAGGLMATVAARYRRAR